jgi:DNA-binding PadR family transcriptional regulator
VRNGKLDPSKFVPLKTSEFHIVLSLADAQRHGYGIMRDIEERTGSQVRLGPGTLYRSIKNLLQAGLIEESDQRPDPELDDERRRYYRLTDQGIQVATREAERLQQLVEVARSKNLLEGMKG